MNYRSFLKTVSYIGLSLTLGGCLFDSKSRQEDEFRQPRILLESNERKEDMTYLPNDFYRKHLVVEDDFRPSERDLSIAGEED